MGNLATVIDQEGPEGVIDITPEDLLSSRVVKYNVTFAQIAKLRTEYAVVPEDLSVKENYAMVKKAASHLRGLRTDVEKRRKELKADALAWGKKVDGAAKKLTSKLVEIEEPFSLAKKDYDTAEEIRKREIAIAEERRVDGIAERIAGIKALVEANISSDSATIKAILDRFSFDDVPYVTWAMEFADKAEIATKETVAKLEELYSLKSQQETFAKQQAEVEAKRIAEEDFARRQRELAAEVERARLEAERAAMAAEVEKMRKAAEELAAFNAAKEAEREEAAEAERLKLVEEQAAREALARAGQEKKDKERDESEAYAENERLKMVAEIEAMKKAQEVKETPVVEPVIQKTPITTTPEITTPTEDYRAAGNAMMQFIGNKITTKNLLDSIINGDVPNIKFTGEV